MWCRDCAQDVPARPNAIGSGFACARCGQDFAPKAAQAVNATLRSGMAISSHATDAPAGEGQAAVDAARRAVDQALESMAERNPGASETTNVVSLSRLDLLEPPGATLVDWQFEDALRDVEATLARRPAEKNIRRPLRIDARTSATPAWHGNRAGVPSMRPAGRAAPESSKSTTIARTDSAAETPPSGGWLAWLLLWPGMAALVCGGVLLGCAVVQGRDELWRVGLPIALLGQAAISFGAAMLVEQLWSRRSVARPAPSDDEAFPAPAVRPRPLPQRRRRVVAQTHRPRMMLAESMADEAGLLLEEMQARLDELAERT